MSRPSFPAGPLAAALLSIAYASAGCNDNVGCVFTEAGCDGGGGPISDNEALQPVDGEWIVDGEPEVSTFPTGAQNPGTTPIVLVFTESMQEESLEDAFEVVPSSGSTQPLPGFVQFLVSDARVLVMLPPMALDAGEYVVRLAEDAVPLDLTGQVLELEGDMAELGTFTVAATPPGSPRLVASFPADDATNQSETTEIVAVFDRAVERNSVTPASFDVRVDGADPLNDPPASALMLGGGATDTRVFLYRSIDAEGVPAPLGTNASVQLILSPAGDPIEEEDGGTLAPRTITFDTLPLAPPLSAHLFSRPSDAIGLANLTDGDLDELMVEVTLEDKDSSSLAQPGDAVDLFMFGVQKTSEEEKPLIALQRQVRLSDPAPIDMAIFTREDVGIQRSSAPDDAHFEDGPVTFAFRLRRGSAVTPVRLLDLDSDPDVIQDVLLDTDRPAVEAVGSFVSPTGTGTATFRSDQRDLGLAGRADEDLASVEVSTPLVTNGALAPVVGTTPTGMEKDHLFLAAPVELGILPGGTTTYSLVARDEALNQSPVVGGTFTQLGAVGPGPFAPGDSIEVEVFDANTLATLPDALVLVHSDRGNGLDFPFFASGSTDPDGRVTLATEGAPLSAGAIVTVELVGFDLFTLHGVPSTRLSVPLRRTVVSPAVAGGFVRSMDPGAVAFLKGLDQRFDDSRRPPELPRGLPVSSCDSSQGLLTCSYGPVQVSSSRVGAQSFYAGLLVQEQATFQESQLLRAFALSVPVGTSGLMEVEFLLDDPAAPPEERIRTVPAFVLEVPSGSGVDLGMLPPPEGRTGEPFVTVETLVPGLGGAVAVSQGVAFAGASAGTWTIRAVQPGAITPEGSLGTDGRVDTDPFVRVEVVDDMGNAAGLRPRISSIAAGTPVLQALAVPTQLAPPAAGSSGGQAFLLRLRHAIGDERGKPGLYRVELADDVGRGWTLWRFDAAGMEDVQIRVVDVAAEGGTGLSDGPILSSTAAWAWSSLAPADFLWSDVEREFELFSRSATLTFTKP